MLDVLKTERRYMVFDANTLHTLSKSVGVLLHTL